MKKNISIHLKSNSLLSKVSTLTISTIFLFGVIWRIWTQGMEMISIENLSTRELFSFIVLSVIGVTIPVVLTYAVGKAVILKENCLIDFNANELSVIETNILTKSSRIIRNLNISNLNEIIYFRIHEDEDGIVNNYHIYMTTSDGKYEKIHTFNKFHYVVNFINKISEKTKFDSIDWTDINFEKESDFEKYYVKNINTAGINPS